MTAVRRMARSTLEDADSIHGSERITRGFLNEEGRKALAWLHLRGACRDMHPATFFPAKGVSGQPAYAVCATCNVRTECLTFSLRTVEREGIWGQTNEKLRRPLLRRVAAGELAEDVAASYVPALRQVSAAAYTGGVDLTEDETQALIDRALLAATAAMAEMLSEALERIDTLSGVVAAVRARQADSDEGAA